MGTKSRQAIESGGAQQLRVGAGRHEIEAFIDPISCSCRMGAEDSDAFSGLLGALANMGDRTKGVRITNVCLGSKGQCEVGRAYENAVQVRHREPRPASTLVVRTGANASRGPELLRFMSD